MKLQRLRVTFGRGDEMKYITHLDLMRYWERALRRAELPVAYSEGFSPHAQLSLAAPLAVGTTGESELMDVFMAEAIAPRLLITQLTPQLSPGLTIRSVAEVGMALPALQADVRFAEYEIDVPPAPDAAALVERFLAAATVPWEHKREDEVRSYDIRAFVEEVDIVRDDADGVRLRMRLQNDNKGSGRPEQVVAALGFSPPTRIHRTQLVLAGTSPSRDARRKHGRFET